MSNRRLARVQEAVRPAMKARLMLAGPAGAGKTHTALTIAAALCPGEKPLVIDTEEESALTYADTFSFVHLPWDPPFNPQELSEVVAEAAANYPCIIIDSATHFWNDEGGTLDVAAGKFTGWKAARPMQRDLISSVLRAPTHMIVCVRSKMEHAQELDAKTGKQVVTKLGMAPVQDATFEFEMNVSCELDMAHKLSISKTRCDLLDGREFAAGHAADMARIYGDWLKGGEPVAAAEAIAGLVGRMNGIADEDARKRVKADFVERFGRPDHLFASKLADAERFVASHESANTGATQPEGGQSRPQADPVATTESANIADSDCPGEAGASAPAPSPKMSQTTNRRLFAMLNEAGIDDAQRHNWASGQLRREVTSFSELSEADGSALCDVLKTAAAS